MNGNPEWPDRDLILAIFIIDRISALVHRIQILNSPVCTLKTECKQIAFEVVIAGSAQGARGPGPTRERFLHSRQQL
jgi:hypothetical protein